MMTIPAFSSTSPLGRTSESRGATLGRRHYQDLEADRLSSPWEGFTTSSLPPSPITTMRRILGSRIPHDADCKSVSLPLAADFSFKRFSTASVVLSELSAARHRVDDCSRELELYGGDSSLHREYLRRSKQVEDMAIQIRILKERVAAIRRARAQSVEMENKQVQALTTLSEIQDAALNDLLTRMKVIGGAVLNVSSFSSSTTDFSLIAMHF